MSNIFINYRKQLENLGYTAEAVNSLVKPIHGEITSLEDVHHIIHSFEHYRIANEYNSSHTISDSIMRGSLSCLEAALIASDLISLLKSHRRLMIITRLDPKDNTQLGHTALIYRAANSLYAAIAMSRYESQSDRPAKFATEEDVVLSFAETYISLGYKPLCFGLADIDRVSDGLNWRQNNTAMLQLQDRLLDSQINSFDISYSS